MKRPLALILLFSAPPLMAGAQTWPGWPGPPPHGYDPYAAQAEQHRQAMESLRLQADRREAEARRQRLDAALTIQRLEAARPPRPPAPPTTAYGSPPAPAVVPAPRDQTAREVDQIDAWLNRPPGR